jgi:phosphohistidine phosphatase
MKRLLIVRHAKSSWTNPLIADFDRPLNKRGEKDAPRMARRLKERKIIPNLVITSPATRAVSTCKEFCEELGYPIERIQSEKKLYHASEKEILSILQLIKDHPKDKEEIVILFGHNPGLTEFANSLLNEDIENIPTCGIISCSLDINSWKELNWESGKLEFFDYPKKD